jgi:hypothetical protein
MYNSKQLTVISSLIVKPEVFTLRFLFESARALNASVAPNTHWGRVSSTSLYLYFFLSVVLSLACLAPFTRNLSLSHTRPVSTIINKFIRSIFQLEHVGVNYLVSPEISFQGLVVLIEDMIKEGKDFTYPEGVFAGSQAHQHCVRVALQGLTDLVKCKDEVMFCSVAFRILGEFSNFTNFKEASEGLSSTTNITSPSTVVPGLREYFIHETDNGLVLCNNTSSEPHEELMLIYRILFKGTRVQAYGSSAVFRTTVNTVGFSIFLDGLGVHGLIERLLAIAKNDNSGMGGGTHRNTSNRTKLGKKKPSGKAAAIGEPKEGEKEKTLL